MSAFEIVRSKLHGWLYVSGFAETSTMFLISFILFIYAFFLGREGRFFKLKKKKKS